MTRPTTINTSRPPGAAPPAVASPTRRAVVTAVSLLLAVALAVYIPDVALAKPKGGGGGWGPLTDTLAALVPIAGVIGMVVGAGIAASAGSNSDGRELGWKIFGGSLGGLILGLLAPDLADLLTNW